MELPQMRSDGVRAPDEYALHDAGRASDRADLDQAGLSMRAIASATGLGRGTVQREIESTVPNRTVVAEDGSEPIEAEVVDDKPATITGRDGRRRPARKQAARKRNRRRRRPSRSPR
jgi:hypothetical protein